MLRCIAPARCDAANVAVAVSTFRNSSFGIGGRRIIALQRSSVQASTVTSLNLTRHTVAPHRASLARFHSSASTASSSSNPSKNEQPPVREAELEEIDVLAHSYFPFTQLPSRLSLESFPLCRVGFGGTPRPGNNATDASAAVSEIQHASLFYRAKSYIRLGGNVVDLTRGFSLDMMDAFKELISSNQIHGNIILSASVSMNDLITFVKDEESRWQDAEKRLAARNKDHKPRSFVSALLPPDGVKKLDLVNLLPHLPQILPKYVEYFLDLHDLGSIDLLMVEPPLINLNPGKIPDAAFEWMGGVDSELTNTEAGYLQFLSQWFTALEMEVARGSIKSYGLASSRFTFQPVTSTNSSNSKQQNHTSKFAVDIEKVIQTATDSARAVQKHLSTSDSTQSSAAPSTFDHHLSTFKFPFTVFNAPYLLREEFLPSLTKRGFNLIGEQIFDGVEPNHREWVRFQEIDGHSKDGKKLMAKYVEAMQRVTTLEYMYKSMMEEFAKEPGATASLGPLPNRIPDLSWGNLIHTHQNELYNPVSWESTNWNRIKPSLQRSLGLLKNHSNPKLSDWIKQYEKGLTEACLQFERAMNYSNSMLVDKYNSKLVACCDKLHFFPTLEEKTILILLSTGMHTLMTDQTMAFDAFANTLVKLFNQHTDKEKAFGIKLLQAHEENSKEAEQQQIPTITTVLQHYLLTKEELKKVLDMLQTDIAPILPAKVMMDELRRHKPSSAF